MAVTVAKRRYVLQVIELVPSFKMPTEAQQQPQQIEEVNAATSASSASDAEPVAPVQSAAQGPIPPSPPLQQPAVSAPSTQQRRPRPSTRPRQLQQQSLRLPPRQRLKQPVAASSYGAIVLQVLLFTALIGGFLFVSTRVALPLSLDLIAQHFGDESSRALVKSLTPMFWFALGYLFVAAIRSRVRPLFGHNPYEAALKPDLWCLLCYLLNRSSRGACSRGSSCGSTSRRPVLIFAHESPVASSREEGEDKLDHAKASHQSHQRRCC